MSSNEPTDPESMKKAYLSRVENRFEEDWLIHNKKALDDWFHYCETRAIDMPTSEISKVVIEDFADYLDIKYDYAGRTIANRVSCIRKFLVYASDPMYGWIPILDESEKNSIYNADLNIDMSTRHHQETGDEIEYISRGDFHSMLWNCESVREKLICRLLWDTGCRPTEALHIQCIDEGNFDEDGDIDFDSSSIDINTAKKRDTDDRTVYFRPETGVLIRKWIYGGYRNISSSYARKSPYLIPSSHSERMSVSRMNEIVQEVFERAGIQDVAYESEYEVEGKTVERKYKRYNAKSFRHSFAHHRVKEGMPVPILAEIMGHDSTETLSNYANFDEEERKEMYEKYMI